MSESESERQIAALQREGDELELRLRTLLNVVRLRDTAAKLLEAARAARAQRAPLLTEAEAAEAATQAEEAHDRVKTAEKTTLRVFAECMRFQKRAHRLLTRPAGPAGDAEGAASAVGDGKDAADEDRRPRSRQRMSLSPPAGDGDGDEAAAASHIAVPRSPPQIVRMSAEVLVRGGDDGGDDDNVETM